ncbi:MAG TPA: 50S ribosomal protein L24 [Bacteroidia bacterium]|jgi:large subunit ribosomal protein L24|nr:50S ribosomal protein L24 [Bacteroidia bacterium]
MKTKIKLKKGDMVKVLAGNSRGQEGKILDLDTDKYRAFVEGINIVSKHTKPNQKTPKGGIVKKEASVHLSNLMLVDPASGKPTRVGRKIDEKTGKLVRYSKKTGEAIK